VEEDGTEATGSRPSPIPPARYPWHAPVAPEETRLHGGGRRGNTEGGNGGAGMRLWGESKVQHKSSSKRAIVAFRVGGFWGENQAKGGTWE